MDCSPVASIGRHGFMRQRRGMFALCATVVLASSVVGVLAQNKDDTKRDDAQKKEIQSIVKSADDATAGQPAPNDLAIGWLRDDALNAHAHKEYVPVTVSSA